MQYDELNRLNQHKFSSYFELLIYSNVVFRIHVDLIVDITILFNILQLQSLRILLTISTYFCRSAIDIFEPKLVFFTQFL